MFLIVWFFLIALGFSGRASGLDETTRYSGYRAFSLPDLNRAPQGTTIAVACDWVESTEAFDEHGIKTSLFSDCGPVLLKPMTKDLSVMPLPDFNTLVTEREKFGYMIYNELFLSDDEATILFSGKYRQMQAIFHLMQNLGSGVFLQLEIPVKRQVINAIGWESLLAQDAFKPNVGGKSRDEKYVGLKQLIDDEYTNPAVANQKASFSRMLTESGFEDFKKEFREIGFGDINFYVGWGDRKVFEESIARYAEGSVRIGLVAPVGKTSKEDRVFSLPVGSEHHWAVAARGLVELGLFSWCSVGGSLGSTIFFPKKYKVRLHDKVKAQGWIRLDSERVRVNRGSLWDVNLYTKVIHAPKGLSSWMGVSYSAQGLTHFTEPKDTEIFTNEVLNSDERIGGWQHFGLHWGMQCDARGLSEKKILPLIKCTYDYSLAGEKVWKSNVIGGTLGIYAEWTW